ncbi:hypothetical protein CTA1_11297 [Colletotrichum tanaceti]|uniref:Uncharacterized protein n=1 Tax=Colletotrichum tanaceti TaxID=1306861 RepID=A0A4U6XMI2_9PEZI|nr:hypothetical protein CTA1_11297 [Colletotrichum tanaceti]
MMYRNRLTLLFFAFFFFSAFLASASPLPSSATEKHSLRARDGGDSDPEADTVQCPPGDEDCDDDDGTNDDEQAKFQEEWSGGVDEPDTKEYDVDDDGRYDSDSDTVTKECIHVEDGSCLDEPDTEEYDVDERGRYLDNPRYDSDSETVTKKCIYADGRCLGNPRYNTESDAPDVPELPMEEVYDTGRSQSNPPPDIPDLNANSDYGADSEREGDEEGEWDARGTEDLNRPLDPSCQGMADQCLHDVGRNGERFGSALDRERFQLYYYGRVLPNRKGH